MLEFDGAKLKQLRKSRNLTQMALARRVGRETSHISNYENGVATPPSDVLLSLLQFFEIPADALARPKQPITGTK